MALENDDKKIGESISVGNEMFSLDIDSLGLFSNYFPHNNVEKVIRTCMMKKSRKKSRHMSKRFQSRGGRIKEESNAA